MLEPYRALQQKAGNEKEVGQQARAGGRGNDAGNQKKSAQDGNTAIERLADVHEHGFHVVRRMALR